MKKVDPKVDEAIQTLNMKDGPSRRKLLTGTGLVSATAAAASGLRCRWAMTYMPTADCPNSPAWLRENRRAGRIGEYWRCGRGNWM